MTITNGYTTLNEFKAFALPEGSSDSADDAVIEAIIDGVSRVIDDQTCRRFWKDSTDVTRYFTARAADLLEVPDLVSVTSLATDDGLRTYATTWAVTDYDLMPFNAAADNQPYRRIAITPNGLNVFPANRQKGVKLVGKFGWPAVPDPIETACKIAAKSIYHSRFGQNENAVSTITGAGVVITPKDFPAECWTMINPYRMRR